MMSSSSRGARRGHACLNLLPNASAGFHKVAILWLWAAMGKN
jgi:hypothetical protein